MNISPEIWEIGKALLVAYVVFVLNKTDRNQRELFKRLRSVELECAGNHGLRRRKTDTEDEA